MTDATLLTEQEAAARLQIHDRTLRRERQAGNIPYILIGRCVRYHPDDLAQLIDRKRVTAAPAGTKRTSHGARKSNANRASGVIVPFTQRPGGRK